MIVEQEEAATALFERAFGASWRRGPIPTALDVLETDMKRAGAWQSPRTMPPPALLGGTETPLLWTRQLSDAELAQPCVIGIDKRTAYLSVLGGLELGIGNAQRDDWTRVIPLDVLQRPGYWRVRCGFPPVDPRFPDPLARDRRRGEGDFWITTPALELARELDMEVNILESWTWPMHKRVLRPFGERCTLARRFLDGVVLASDVSDHERHSAQEATRMLKDVYAPVLGGFLARRADHECRPPWFRPDWRHHIIAKARANLWRTLARLRTYGLEPIGIYNDAAYYVSARPAVLFPSSLRTDTFSLGEAKPLGEVVRDGRLSWPLLFGR